MRQPWILPAAAAVVFVLALIACFPAALAWRWFAPANATGSGLSGTLWNGSAATLSVGGVRLTETHWDLSTLPLLLGRVSADVEAQLGEAKVQGAVTLTGSGFRCEQCRYDGPVTGLHAAIPALRSVDGQLQLDLSSFEWREGWPTTLVATADLKGMPVAPPGTPAGPNTPRGDYRLAVNADPVPEGGVIEGELTDAGGPVELQARLTLTPPGSFALSGQAKARADAPAPIVQALTMLGGQGPQAQTELNLSGTF